MVSIRTLQCFAGKFVSMSLAIPKIRLYCKDVTNVVTCKCVIKSSKKIVIGDELRAEVK